MIEQVITIFSFTSFFFKLTVFLIQSDSKLDPLMKTVMVSVIIKLLLSNFPSEKFCDNPNDSIDASYLFKID